MYHQYRELQRRRRDRSGDRVDVGARGPDLLADAARLHAACGRDQRRPHGMRLSVDRIPTVGVLPGGVMAELNADVGRIAAREKIALVTGIALLVAGLILVAAVLPAEYGVDPLGIGRRLGLLAIGEVQKKVAAFEATRAADAGGVPT